MAGASFREAGYLESDDRTRIAQVRQRHSPWFAFIDRLNRLAMAVLLVETPRVPVELYAATLYARAVTLFQGAVLMAERGMATEGRTLVRSCAETAIALGCMRRDERFLEQLDEDHDKYRIATANDLLSKLPVDDPNISPEQRIALRTMIAEVSSQYAAPRPRRINWADASIAAGMVDLYMTVYREASGDAAHVSLKALERHIALDAQGDITGFRFQPDLDGALDTLSPAIACLLHATEAKLVGASNSDADAELRVLASEWNALVGATE